MTALDVAAPATQVERSPRARRQMIVIAVLASAAIVLFVTWDVQGSWSYVVDLRTRQVGALLVVGVAVGASSLVFQTVAGNRVLTPGVMGFDALYVLIQTVIVASFGASALQLMGVVERFALNTVLLTAFGLLLFRWLFRSSSRNLFVLVLVGIVLGTLFASASTLASRVMSPDDFLTLQTVLFASFTTVDPALLVVTAVCTAGGIALLTPELRRLDVIALGRDTAISLGVPYHRTVTRVLVAVTVLVATSTALVGPMLFLGLLVANLARQVMPTHRHCVLMPASALIGVIATVAGQFLVVHVFDLRTTISVVINLVGGVYFIALLLKVNRL